MTDPEDQIGYACEELFPDGPFSADDGRDFFENADTLDLVMYLGNEDDDITELAAIVGTRVYEIYLKNGIWIGPHNTGGGGVVREDKETPKEVGERYLVRGWNVLVDHTGD